MKHHDVVSETVAILLMSLNPAFPKPSCPELFKEEGAYIEGVRLDHSFNCARQEFRKDFFLDSVEFGGESFFSNAIALAGFSVEKTKAHGYASFQGMQVRNSLSVIESHWLDTADFRMVSVGRNASFNRCVFMKDADFSYSDIQRGRMQACRFEQGALFETSNFYDTSEFVHVEFLASTSFSGSRFLNRALFKGCVFGGSANFSHVRFDHSAMLSETSFRSGAVFNNSSFQSAFDIKDSRFSGKVSFVDADFSSDAIVRFRRVEILDTLVLGSPRTGELQRFDLHQATFLPGARVILAGLVDLRIQREKLSHVEIQKDLDYFSKQALIFTLKKSSFDSLDVRSQFDLEYKFAQSVKGQAKSDRFMAASLAESFRDWLYDFTLGLGYRPLRLAYWIVAFILLAAGTCNYMFPAFIVKHYAISGPRISFAKRMPYAVFYCASLFFLLKFPRTLLVTLKPFRLAAVSLLVWLAGIGSYLILITATKFDHLFPGLKNLLQL